MMKAIVVLFALLAVIVGSAMASGGGPQQPCDPDGDGKPCCCWEVGKFRNNWDPSAYWECTHIGGDPVRRRCPDKVAVELFDPILRRCVPAKDYHWTPICPKNE